MVSEGRAEEKFLRTPDIRDGSLVRWIMERTEARGGSMAPNAAAMLASFVGGRLQQMDREIEKLVLYAAGERITKEHVVLLVQDARAARIFDLTDAVSAGKRKLAIRLYRRLLSEGGSPLWVLSMLARQYRILLSVKALADKGMREREIASKLGLARYPVQKALGEVHRFTYERLIRSHDLILRADNAIKSGEMSADVAVELLVASL
jgi:DNA polymerase-3 subunit delta